MFSPGSIFFGDSYFEKHNQVEYAKDYSSIECVKYQGEEKNFENNRGIIRVA